MGTGLIFAAVVIAWAVFLVPWALRRYDEATRARSVDTFSRGMRLLGRSKPKGASAGAGVSTAATGVADVDGPSVAAAEVGEADGEVIPADEVEVEVIPADEQPIAARPALKKSTVATAQVEPPRRPSRTAARVAAQRRRRVLGILLGLTVVVGALTAFAVVPPWSAAIPGTAVVGFLALCRWQVRREDDAAWVRRRASQSESSAEDDEATVVLRKTSAEGATRRHAVEADAGPVGDADLAESTSVAVTVPTEDGRSLWDPLPVTLPTYVSKAKATRTVRTIDLGEPDAWTSGRVEGEQTELPGSDGDSATGDDADAQQRAVGD